MRVIVSLHPLKLHLWPLVNCVLLCLLTVLCLGLDPAGLSTVCLAGRASSCATVDVRGADLRRPPTTKRAPFGVRNNQINNNNDRE